MFGKSSVQGLATNQRRVLPPSCGSTILVKTGWIENSRKAGRATTIVKTGDQKAAGLS